MFSTGHLEGCRKSIRVVRNYFVKFANNDRSRHFWIDSLRPLSIKRQIDVIRNHPSLLSQLKKTYKGYKIVPVHQSDEVYLSVSPDKRKGSDKALSDCHYDAPFAMVPQGGNKFIRMIIALNYNDSVYTQVGKQKSVLSTGDFNIIDYNRDYHCVHGSIPHGRYRLLLKLHFVLVPENSSEAATQFCIDINNWWIHASRTIMNMSINPQTFGEHSVAYIVETARLLYNNANLTISSLLLLLLIVLCCISGTFRGRLTRYSY